MRLLKNISFFSFIISTLNCSILRPQLKGTSEFKPVLLSFDDGPNNIDSVTLKLLIVLKKHNVKACFCLIGKNVKQYPEIVKQIYLDGHILVNHGNDGSPFIFKKTKTCSPNIEACNTAICDAINNCDYKVEYFRPGYGAFRRRQKTAWESNNMRLVPVTDFFFDHKIKPEGMERLVAQFCKSVKKNNGGAYVLHDGRNEFNVITAALKKAEGKSSNYNRTWVPTAVDQIILELKKSGYAFPPLNDSLPNKLDPAFESFLYKR